MAAHTSSTDPKPWKLTRDKTARAFAEIVIGDAELMRAEEEGLKAIGKDVSIKGFRPGQAPLDVVREHAGEEAVLDAAIRAVLSPLLPRVVQEENLKPILAPQVGIVQKSPLTIRVTFVEAPAASVKKLDAKAFKKEERSVEEKDIERVIANLIKESANETTVDRAARDGDVLIADFWGEDEEKKEIPNTRSQDYRIEIGSATLIPGFEDGVIGMKAGDHKHLDLTFPKNYQAEHLRGKRATFHITAKEVREVKMPELTAELIEQKTGTKQTPDEFRAMVRGRMQEQEDAYEKQRREEALFDAIGRATNVQLPEELIHAETEALLAHMAESLKEQNTSLDDWLKWRKKEPQEFLNETKERAKKRLTLRFGVESLLKTHEIALTDDDPEKEWEMRVKALMQKLLAE